MQAEILAQGKGTKRIASDLHDDLGPLLSAVKFKINSVDLINDDDKASIESASQHIDDTLAKVRELHLKSWTMPNTLSGRIESRDY
jgi:signal transduction histidine kinase